MTKEETQIILEFYNARIDEGKKAKVCAEETAKEFDITVQNIFSVTHWYAEKYNLEVKHASRRRTPKPKESEFFDWSEFEGNIMYDYNDHKSWYKTESEVN